MKSNILIVFIVCISHSIFAQNYGKKFYQTIETSYLLGFGDKVNNKDLPLGIAPAGNIQNHTNGFGVKVAAGYYISEQIDAGIGLGIQGHDYPSTIPLSADIRGVLLKKRNTPFAKVCVGSFFKLNNSWENGNFYKLGLGYRLKLTEKNNAIFSVNYNYSRISDGSYYVTGEINNPQIENIDLYYKSVDFSIGIEL